MSAHGTPVALRNFFAGLTENAFASRLGVVDPPLVDYLVELLVRFIRSDQVYRVRDAAGRRLDEVAAMAVEAEARLGDARREVHRHIGDFTLFWSGVYPEALPRFQSVHHKDRWLDFQAEGKRAYFIASTIPVADRPQENAVLERLSHDFELCVYGLGEVRRDWERRDGDADLLVVN
jgi:hypothetical protein